MLEKTMYRKNTLKSFKESRNGFKRNVSCFCHFGLFLRFFVNRSFYDHF